jgi:hypothetical protein
VYGTYDTHAHRTFVGNLEVSISFAGHGADWTTDNIKIGLTELRRENARLLQGTIPVCAWNYWRKKLKPSVQMANDSLQLHIISQWKSGTLTAVPTALIESSACTARYIQRPSLTVHNYVSGMTNEQSVSQSLPQPTLPNAVAVVGDPALHSEVSGFKSQP